MRTRDHALPGLFRTLVVRTGVVIPLLVLSGIPAPLEGQELGPEGEEAAVGAPAVEPTPFGLPESDTVAAGSPADALRPGDLVEVNSWREPEVAGEYPVDEDGRVLLPHLGFRNATEIPPDEFRRELMREYADSFGDDGVVQVSLKRRVRLLGQVGSPGLYHVDRSMTLGDLLAQAGGIPDAGDRNRIRIARPGGSSHEVALRSDTTLEELIQSGDQITVPRRHWLRRHAGSIVGAAVSSSIIWWIRGAVR